MKLKLALNTGFAVNRFILPEQWVYLFKDELGINYAQVTADMFMPYLIDPLAKKIAERTRNICEKKGFIIDSTFTGAFTRLNNFSHPVAEVRDYTLKWFKAFADISVILGANSLGSHLGIQTIPENIDPESNQQILNTTIHYWEKLAEYASKIGLKYLTWEPMSISREYGETLEKASYIQSRFNKFPLPVKICLDVDHGDVSSANKDDTNPYRWIEKFGKDAPLIHLKQSHIDKGSHWPFTPEHNAKGKIIPELVISSLTKAGAEEVCLILELSFRERSTIEKTMIDDLKESVNFWITYCS